MHIKCSKLPPRTSAALLRFFIAGSTARVAAQLLGIHKNSAALYFHRLRMIIHENTKHDSPLDGEIEVDESYFGGVRKGKRGRGAAGKIPVFGILKRNGKVYTRIIPDAKSKTLMPIMESRITPDSIVYHDGLSSYNILDTSGFKHYRINHSKEFVNAHCAKSHINGIENFWNQAKRHLRKFNGVPKEHFYLFLKECEWRFNHAPASNLLKVLKYWIKCYNARQVIGQPLTF